NLAGRTWGCNPNILRWMYIMIVRPIMTYGAIAWHSKAEQSTTRKTLNTVQRLACTCITGAMRTCPTAALEVITDLTPLHLVIERAANEATLRVTREGSGNERMRHQREWSSLTKHIPHLDLPSDETVRRYNFERNITTKLSDKKSWEREPTTHAFKENTIKWYTDGSKTNKGTGAGVYGPGTKYSEALGIYPSVFQAEIHASERCIEFNLLK